MEAALAALDSQKHVDYTATTEEFNVHRTTLSRHFKGEQRTRADADQNYKFLFSPEEDKYLVSYINKLTDHRLPPTTRIVRNFVTSIAKKEPRNHWVSRFNSRWATELNSGY
jgi:hypothetical protein